MRLNALSLAAALVAAALLPRAAKAEEAPAWTLRLGGGYGISMNETYYGNINRSRPLSPGWPLQAEVVRGLGGQLSLELGVYGVAMERSYEYLAWNGVGYSSYKTKESAVFLPVLVGLSMERPLGPRLSLLLGLGAGVVPSTIICIEDAGGSNLGENIQMDAGFAWRSQLALRWKVWDRLGLLAGLQVLGFNQHWFAPHALGGDWLADAKTFNQIAPCLLAEWQL